MRNLSDVGSVAEWLNALVLKTSEGQPFVGSNPTASANNRCGRRLPRKSVAFAPIFAPICSRKSPEGGPSGLFCAFSLAPEQHSFKRLLRRARTGVASEEKARHQKSVTGCGLVPIGSWLGGGLAELYRFRALRCVLVCAQPFVYDFPSPKQAAGEALPLWNNALRDPPVHRSRGLAA